MRTFMTRFVLPVALTGALLLGVLTTAVGDGGQRMARTLVSAPERKPPREPHAVLLIMDELPADSLLGAGGRRIDPVRYPNFAALAADSTWFRNAYSVYDSTTKAVPLILDGMHPRPGTSPDRAGHPRSVFDMFARRGYRMVAGEEASALCPPSMCRGGRTEQPDVMRNLNQGRPRRFNRWVRSIRSTRRPTFWMKHLLLPHGPYVYLPSGVRSRPRPRDPLPGMNTVPGFHDEFLTRHNEQRYLLQLGYTDRLLGRLVRRMKREGIYDDSLLVVTADHGYLWRPGVTTRRRSLDSTVAELGPVPLFVKRPGQSRGRVSGTLARTLDVPSTIADVLGYRLGYRDDGRSAFSPAARRSRAVSHSTRDFTAVVHVPARRWKAQRRAVVRRRLRQFGSGDLASLFSGIGPNRELIGRTTTGVARVPADGLRASIVGGELFADVRRASGVVPTEIAGGLTGGAAGEERDLAVAVNGRIEAVGRSFHLQGDPRELFAVMVPEAALVEGANSVEVLEVREGGRLRLVERG
jgi:hypothetical protein